MARSFYYLIDGLTPEKGQRLKKALEQIPEISSVFVRPDHGVIELEAARNPEAQVELACAIAGTTLRVEVKKRSLF